MNTMTEEKKVSNEPKKLVELKLVKTSKPAEEPKKVVTINEHTSYKRNFEF